LPYGAKVDRDEVELRARVHPKLHPCKPGAKIASKLRWSMFGVNFGTPRRNLKRSGQNLRRRMLKSDVLKLS
jgi:hypothetical protein